MLCPLIDDAKTRSYAAHQEVPKVLDLFCRKIWENPKRLCRLRPRHAAPEKANCNLRRGMASRIL